jgi:hypothetical protein
MPTPAGQAPTKDRVIGGQDIMRGETVFMLWASGNRDPEVFDDPDEVRLDGQPNRHLTFRTGGHRCSGATLARVELRVMLTAILRRLPDLHILDSIRPGTVGIVYGFTSVPASFKPGVAQGRASHSASFGLDGVAAWKHEGPQRNESEVLEQLRDLRILYTHRGSPMVISYRGGPVLHSQNQLNANVGINETTGPYFLERLAPHLIRPIESAGAFAHERLATRDPSA